MKKGDTFEKDFTISESIYIGFVNLFNDRNPLHTDPQFAKEKGFDNVVMHGNILNGFISYFIGECLLTKDVIIHSQEIKFIKPIYLNQQLFFRAEILDVFDSVNAVELKFSFFTKDDMALKAKGKIQIGILK